MAEEGASVGEAAAGGGCGPPSEAQRTVSLCRDLGGGAAYLLASGEEKMGAAAHASCGPTLASSGVVRVLHFGLRSRCAFDRRMHMRATVGIEANPT